MRCAVESTGSSSTLPTRAGLSISAADATDGHDVQTTFAGRAVRAAGKIIFWGRMPFETDDLSRNNFIFGILAMGEGWHNNHHAFPTSARHGLRWWQVNGSYLVIRLLKATHLAWNIRVPDDSAITSKQTHHQLAAEA